MKVLSTKAHCTPTQNLETLQKRLKVPIIIRHISFYTRFIRTHCSKECYSAFENKHILYPYLLSSGWFVEVCFEGKKFFAIAGLLDAKIKSFASIHCGANILESEIYERYHIFILFYGK